MGKREVLLTTPESISKVLEAINNLPLMQSSPITGCYVTSVSISVEQYKCRKCKDEGYIAYGGYADVHGIGEAPSSEPCECGQLPPYEPYDCGCTEQQKSTCDLCVKGFATSGS